jgi:hypothetical protein
LFFNQEEARASQEGTAGLKVFVDIYHNRRGSAQLCVYSTYEDLGCNTINLSQYPSPVRSGPYTFSPEMVQVGESFRVCVTNLNTGGQSRCISGTNGPEKEPEYISIAVPGTQQQLPAAAPHHYHHRHRNSYLGFYVLALTGGRYVTIMTYTLLSHVGR